MRGRILSLPKISFSLKPFKRRAATHIVSSGDAPRSGTSKVAQLLSLTRRRITCLLTINAQLEVTSTPTPTYSHPSHRWQARNQEPNAEKRSLSGDKGKDINNYGVDTMSESARIAYEYRSFGSREEQVLCVTIGELDSTQSTQGVFDSALCPPQRLTTCPESYEDGQLKGHSHRLEDMLCHVSPVIVEKPREEQNLNDVLQSYRRSSHIIVLHSPCPEIAPHIVVTPPSEQESSEASHVAENNRIVCQRMPDLMVPPFFGFTCRMHTYSEWTALFYAPPQTEEIYQDEQPETSGVQLVFKHASFRQWIARTESERLCHFTRLVVPAVQRHLFKAVAITATLAAGTFRARYDLPGFLESLEHPYQWNDPAEALLACYPIEVKRILSTRPFSIPHIVIHEAPPNDPELIEGNVPPIQNYRFGKNLVVLSYYCTVVSYDDDPQCIESEDYSSDANTDTSSSQDSAGPETPTDLQRVQSGFFDSSPPGGQCYAGSEDIQQLESSIEASLSQTRAKFYIDEDDEDLPPIEDEWYTTIIDRVRESGDTEGGAMSTTSSS